jgi:hypothetical protein
LEELDENESGLSWFYRFIDAEKETQFQYQQTWEKYIGIEKVIKDLENASKGIRILL